MKNTVVGLGEILWDVFPDRKVLGGAPTNFAYHITQFGFNGYAVSAVGEDLFGEEILKALKDKELNYTIEYNDYPTGSVKVSLDNYGVPTYTISEDVAWDHIAFTAKLENLAKNTGTVSFGTLAQRNEVSRTSIMKFINAMPNDSLKIFDINLRQNYYSLQVIEDSLKVSNILKINDEEVAILAILFNLQEKNEEDICKFLVTKYKLKLLILTKGTRGSFIFSENDFTYHRTPAVQIADTVGAGDSFTASFIAAYLNKWSIDDAHKLAIEVSAYVCSQHGAMPKLPDAYLELFR